MDTELLPCDLRIGTSGYYYPEWEGSLYPAGIGRKEYFSAYCTIFSTVEINSSYYGIPKAENIKRLLTRVKGPIDFAVKAHKSLTHEVSPATWSDNLRGFTAGIQPLAEADRLCAVLLQFPSSFQYREDERRYLDKLTRALAAFPLVVELRNIDWFNARAIEGLKERDVGLCALDMPHLEGLPPVSDFVTSDIGYVRFHGRNGAAWWSGDGGNRYDYKYTNDELKLWMPRLKSMSLQAKKLRVFFNNHRKTNSPENALTLCNLARAAGLL